MTVFIAALVASALATPIVRCFAVRWRLGDKPNGRRIHPDLIPHLGGIALLIGVAAGVAMATEVHIGMLLKSLPAALIVIALGLVDDTRNLAARTKLVVQAVAAAALVAVGFRLLTGVDAFDAFAIGAGVLSLVFIVGMLSSVNLIDGHDGLAAGVALIASTALAVVAAVVGAVGVVPWSLALCGACAGFLLFNFPPARIYMGDTGSMLLGLVLAQVACWITMGSPSASTFAAVLLVLAVPILDTLLAIARRAILRAPIFTADHLHVHHVLRDGGLSPRKTLLVLYGLQVVLAGLGVATAAGYTIAAFVGVVVAAVAFASFLRAMVANRAAKAPAPQAAIPQPVARVASTPLSFQSSITAQLSERRTSVGR